MEDEDELQDVTFDHTNSYIACASNRGVQVFHCPPESDQPEPFRFDHEGKNTGVGLVHLDGKHRLFFVGGAEFPCAASTTVLCHEAATGCTFAAYKFRTPITAIRVQADIITILTEHKAFLYETSSRKLIYTATTMSNPRGLVSLAPGYVLAVPGLRTGEVVIQVRARKKVTFQAHDNPLACMMLSLDGTLLATASVKGTLVRIFNTAYGEKRQELRRGKDQAEVTSMAFSPDNRWLVLTSDKQTVHVFSLVATVEAEELSESTSSSSASASSPQRDVKVSNPVSSLSLLRGVLPRYFSSEWSFAQFRLPTKSRAVAVFSPQESLTVLIACFNGNYFKLSFDPSRGGYMRQLDHRKF